jgi:hypothetical protein
MAHRQRDAGRNAAVLSHELQPNNLALRTPCFETSRQCGCKWRSACAEHVETGPLQQQAVPVDLSLRTPPKVEEKVIHLRSHVPLRSDAHRLAP